MRTEETERKYRHQARLLLDRFEAETAYNWQENPMAAARWVLARRPEWSRGTWRVYRAALALFLREQGAPAEVVELIEQGSQSVCPRRGSHSSALKTKGINDPDLIRLLTSLDGSGKPNDHLIGAWLMAGVSAGLRPGEWEHARLDQDTLRIRNAKATNGRANGEFRSMRLQGQALEAVSTFLSLLSRRIADGDTFANLYHTCRVRLKRRTHKLWPRRKRRPTLYSARHQFAANAKADGRSRREVASLMGHASIETAGSHYARRVVGRTGRTPEGGDNASAGDRPEGGKERKAPVFRRKSPPESPPASQADAPGDKPAA